MLASRIQPSYLTNVCQAGFKKCAYSSDMDLCAHLLHDCIGTGNFTQPELVSLPKREMQHTVFFTVKENKINQRRCKKQKFFAKVFNYSGNPSEERFF